ncbi:MAG: hypothetical protein E7480_03475 [Ruminococcaceae bacterium]|nr:hypothetical protein [Oscillospiraceae bacterium]
MALTAEKKFIPEDVYSAEILRYYATMSKDTSEEATCKSIWDYYAKRNAESIWKSESEIKIARFELLSKKRENVIEDDNVYNLFYDILLIETGLEKTNKKDYLRCMKKLARQLKAYKIDSRGSIKLLKSELKNKKDTKKVLEIERKA